MSSWKLCLVGQEVCKHDLLVAASKIAVICVAGMSKQMDASCPQISSTKFEGVCLFQWADGCRRWINFVSHIGDLRLRV